MQVHASRSETNDALPVNHVRVSVCHRLQRPKVIGQAMPKNVFFQQHEVQECTAAMQCNKQLLPKQALQP
jgi:hypothetical protein